MMMDEIDGRFEWSWREIIKQLEKGNGLFMRSEMEDSLQTGAPI